MLILELKDILQDQVYIFYNTYFKSPQIHQLTIIYRFEDTKHDTVLSFSFRIFLNSFFIRISCISNIFYI